MKQVGLRLSVLPGHARCGIAAEEVETFVVKDEIGADIEVMVTLSVAAER